MSFVACSDDPAAKTPDAAIILIDAAVDAAAPDAPPDAPPPTYDFSCEGVALPTTAAATVTLSGTVSTINIGTMMLEAVEGALVGSHKDLAVEPVADDTDTTLANGAFTLGPTDTVALMPYDVYLKGTKAGNRTSYVYPPSPFVGDQAGIPVLLLTTGTFSLVVSFLGGTQTAPNGAIGTAIVDCAQTPVPEAVLSVKQGGVEVGNTHSAAQLAPGTYLTFDVPPGPTDISATYTVGTVVHTWRTHTVRSFASGTTTTLAAP